MLMPLMFGTPGWSELLVVLLIILVLFGAKKLPELARSLGKSLGEFRKGKAEGEKGDDDGDAGPEKKGQGSSNA